MTERYSIIGSSAAGMAAAAKIRSCKPQAAITIFTMHKGLPYNTCLIADLLAGRATDEAIVTKNTDFFETNRITLHAECRIIAIDAKQKIIIDASGNIHPFDKLLIATGSDMPMPSTWKQALPKEVLRFHTRDDVHAIQHYLDRHTVRHITVIGAGLSGIEAADALCERGFAITIIEKQPHILPALLDTHAAQFVSNIIAAHAVKILCGQPVDRVERAAKGDITVFLADNTSIQTDLVICALGSVPNTAIAQQAGITCDRGSIVVDQHFRTNIPSIFAAGDAILVRNTLTNRLERSCTWPDAVMQGMIAGSCMTDVPRAYQDAAITLSSHFFGTVFISAGAVNTDAPEGDIIQRSGPDFYHKFLLVDEKLRGMLMVGRVDAIGTLRRSLQSNDPVDRNFLLSL